MAAVTRRLCAAWRHVAAPAITGAVLALPLLGAPAPGRAQEQIEQQEPTPSAVEQVATPIELKDAPAFGEKYDDTHLEALAMGGALSLPVPAGCSTRSRSAPSCTRRSRSTPPTLATAPPCWRRDRRGTRSWASSTRG